MAATSLASTVRGRGGGGGCSKEPINCVLTDSWEHSTPDHVNRTHPNPGDTKNTVLIFKIRGSLQMCVCAHIYGGLCICRCCLEIYRRVWVDAGTYTAVDVSVCVKTKHQSWVSLFSCPASCWLPPAPHLFYCPICLCEYMFCICMIMHAEA